MSDDLPTLAEARAILEQWGEWSASLDPNEPERAPEIRPDAALDGDEWKRTFNKPAQAVLVLLRSGAWEEAEELATSIVSGEDGALGWKAARAACGGSALVEALFDELERYIDAGVTPVPVTHTRTCEHCGEPFEATRSDARFHSTACRVAAHRAKSEV